MPSVKYKELKFEGKSYVNKYEINEILIENNLNWFIDCEVENIRIEILKNTLIINAGIFYNGVFEYGVIRDVDWRGGIFMNGVIYNGVFKKIKIENALIFDGTFLKGEIIKADRRGGRYVDVILPEENNLTGNENS
jgi:hypothetical protein